MCNIVCDIIIIDAWCFPPGHAVPLLNGTNNQTTVEGEVITFSCSLRGNYKPLNYEVYWIIVFQNHTSTVVDDNHNIPGYHVNTKKNCPFTNFSCCRFITELSINTVLQLNNSIIMCDVTFIDSIQLTSSSSTLSELLIVNYT